MPDLFGKKQLGRATTGGRFYATPTERVEAGAIYFPDESSLLFGVAEYTVEAGNLGAFATEGTFVFEKPDDWLDSLGRKVFYRPSTGEIVNQDRKGDVLIGFQIFANVPDDKLGVVLTSGENSVVIIVTSTADSGAGSLRQAIADANDGDVILFDADVFPAEQTTSILLSSYLQINKSVSIYGGFSDGAGGYTSGATITHYVKREIDGVETEVVVDDEHPAAEGEIILMHVTTRVAIDGQATQDPNHTGDWDGWTGSRVFAYYGANVVDATFSGVTCRNGLSTTSMYGGCFSLVSTSAQDAKINVVDCAFINGIRSNGGSGGICIDVPNGGATFTRCEFSGFKTQSTGGVYINSGQNTFSDCTFSTNTANYGGAVSSTNTSANTFTDCTFSTNTATNYGGAVYSCGTSANTFSDCTFSTNTANSGGGVYSASTSQNTLNDCTITDCSAANGGGVCSTGTSQNTLNGCIFNSCDAKNGGGFITGSSATNVLTDCTFTNCTATTYGGGVYAGSTSQNTLNDCTFDASSTVYVVSTSALTITGGITTIAAATFSAASITINDGAALTLTDTATIGAAKFTSDGRGYLATAAGIDISSATLTGVVACTYGAGLESFAISADGASWTAQDLTTPILIEQKGDGAVWTTLSDDATGGSYSDSFTIGTTLRAFDGVRFLVASLDAYWQVEPFVVASNGGGGAGDVSPSWTISDATITPNAEEV